MGAMKPPGRSSMRRRYGAGHHITSLMAVGLCHIGRKAWLLARAVCEAGYGHGEPVLLPVPGKVRRERIQGFVR
jgi:hypothetical protein